MTEDYNLYPLHVFRIVARLGSVTRAAQELCVSQPAVSAHLKTLQSRYKETLLERTPKGMLATPAGTAVAEYANRVFGLLEDMGMAVESVSGQVKGNIALAASSTPGAYLAPRLLRRFQDSYPDVQTTLLVGDSRDALAWLHEYRVALAVVGETQLETGLLREAIGEDELRLVTSATDSLRCKEKIDTKYLAMRTLFLREAGSSTRIGAEKILCGRMEDFARVVELGSTEAIKQAVIAGLGVAVLSSWATELEEKAGLLAPVIDARFRQERKFYVVRRAERPFVGAVAALWDCLCGVAPPSSEANGTEEGGASVQAR